jgi:hypothetical protein
MVRRRFGSSFRTRCDRASSEYHYRHEALFYKTFDASVASHVAECHEMMHENENRRYTFGDMKRSIRLCAQAWPSGTSPKDHQRSALKAPELQAFLGGSQRTV